MSESSEVHRTFQLTYSLVSNNKYLSFYMPEFGGYVLHNKSYLTKTYE